MSVERELSPELSPELPPEPATRTITPAPEDYAQPAPRGTYLWPLLWIWGALVLWALVDRIGWSPFAGQ